MKNIRDSVHGNIIIGDAFVKSILDTLAFQRLRRIEQTAIRSIYPSARHDRFIHSLGVYHIGSLIVKHLKEEFAFEMNREGGDGTFWGFDKDGIDIICNSYLTACMLHDIAHAPFSHTFEGYFGSKEVLFNTLNAELNEHLTGELLELKKPNYHEYASAIVVCKEYKKNVIEDVLKADMELVCRMIIGCFYEREKKQHELHNCFISLLHGDVVDADRMDYACRDVWASGYCTSSIDVDRIVSSIHIMKEPNTQELNVCFDSKALNEINNMLDVRQFQNRYVINHHSVQYEQMLMVLAAERAALNIVKGCSNGDEALQQIISVDACHSGNHISDEDLLTLMKNDTDNPYYEEYTTRKYKRFAVWKTPDEFFHYFPEVPRGKDLISEGFEDKVKEALSGLYKPDDIIICEVKYKQPVNLNSLYVVVNGDVVRYIDIHPELQLDLGDSEEDIGFYYLYVPKPEDPNMALKEVRQRIVDLLKPLYMEVHPQTNVEYQIYDFIQNALIKWYEFICKDQPKEAEKKKNQIRNMSKEIDRLDDFLGKTGLQKLIEQFPGDKKKN